ncbi:MAG: TetR/AcrR family transcriptional regulator [Gammaproteobacteria bacterium]|nr:TetR/AcrR family transcriptional regulator [Gammaproteobacteria bacterium]
MSQLKSRRVARAAANNALYTDRKEIILNAAARVFLRKGFLATKLQDIAEEAEMDRASLYYYVGSKQDLFESTYSASIESNIQKARSINKEKISSLDKLAKLIVGLMCSFEEHYPFLYIFVQEDLKKIEQLDDPKNKKWLKNSKKMSEEYFAIILGIVDDGMKKGEIHTTLTPKLITHSLIGMINSSAKWFDPTGPANAKAIGEGMAKMIVNGLKVKS